jgi:hypothetical protein
MCAKLFMETDAFDEIQRPSHSWGKYISPRISNIFLNHSVKANSLIQNNRSQNKHLFCYSVRNGSHTSPHKLTLILLIEKIIRIYVNAFRLMLCYKRQSNNADSPTPSLNLLNTRSSSKTQFPK